MGINAVKQPTQVILNTSQLYWQCGTFVQQEGTLRAICWSHSACRREAAKEEAEWLLAFCKVCGVRRVWCPSPYALLPRRDAPRDADRRCGPPIPLG